MIDNRSAKTVNLSQVVVTATYGPSPARVAAPVHADSATKDFGGTLSAGGTESAASAFAIPTEQSIMVVVTLGFDDVHHPATFAGVTG